MTGTDGTFVKERGLRRGRVVALSYLNFDLLIERVGERYRAQVTASPAGEGTHDFELPFSDKDLEIFVLRIIGLGTRANVRSIEAPEMQYVKQFGGRLFESVFSGAVRDCLIGSIAESEDQEAGLRVRLRLGTDSGLVNVPWECMYDAAFDSFLGLAETTPLVRYIDLPSSPRPLLVKPPLRILMMVASPRGYPGLDADREWANLQGALGPLLQREQVVLERLNVATLAALQGRLQARDYHIFHFIGHGDFDERQRDGVLLLEDEAGGPRPAGASAISTLLRKRSLRLVILNACEGARATESDPFAGTAQTLVRTGIPAVIAMQFEITDEAAIMFSREFYGALAAGLPVDAAVCEARKAIFTQVNAVEWATPVLYMRSRDGRIFDVQTQDEPPPLEIDEPEDADDTDIRVDLPPEMPDPGRVIDISGNEGPAPEDPVPKPPKRDRPAVAVAAALERLSSDPHGPQRYRLLLDNAGRETTEVHLRAQDPDQALILDLSNESVLLPPGQETTTELVVRARGRAWTAQSHEYPFNVVIEPEGDSPKVVRGVLVRPPTITRVRAALAALVVVVVLAGLGLFLFRPPPVETGGGGGGGGGAGAQLAGIAYVRGSDIYIAGSGSGPGDNLTADIDGDCKQPAWSQDGEWVAFSVSRDGESVIYGVRVADGLEVQLPSPSSPPSDTDPAISPDGNLLAFISGPPHQRHLYVAKADGTGSATLIDQGNDTRPAWSPDGQTIVFHRSLNGVAGLAAIPAGGGEARQFTTDPDDQSPSWTPSDGILFHSRRGGECCSLFIFDPDGSSVLPLHVGGAEPSWSPDGQSFAFHRGSEVWVADADGSNRRKILDTGSGNPDPAW